MRASFVCVIQLFLSPMFFVRETIKIYLCSLCEHEFTRLCGVSCFVFEFSRRSSLSSSSLLSRLVRERGSNPGSSARGFRRGSEREDPTGETTKAAEKD